MKIDITFKNMDSSDAVKSHIHDKFDRFDKMLYGHTEAHVVLSEEKLRHIAEINLTSDGIRIHASEEAENNLYSAIDRLSDKVRTQVKKQTEKQKRHLARDKHSIKTDMMENRLSG